MSKECQPSLVLDDDILFIDQLGEVHAWPGGHFNGTLNIKVFVWATKTEASRSWGAISVHRD